MSERFDAASDSILASGTKRRASSEPSLFGETFDMFAGDSSQRGLLEQAAGTPAAAAAMVSNDTKHAPAADFSLETVTAKQLDAEMEKAARKAKLTEKQAAPLQGSAGEYGTPDMLDITAGPMALFSQPAAQKGTLFAAPKRALMQAEQDAVLPDDAPADIREALRKRGIATLTYATKDKTGRANAVREASTTANALFSGAKRSTKTPVVADLVNDTKRQTKAGRTVGTSKPTAKGERTGSGTDPNHNVDLDRLAEVNPAAYRKNAILLARYPLVAREQPELAAMVRKIDAPVQAQQARRDAAANLLELAKEDIRARLAKESTRALAKAAPRGEKVRPVKSKDIKAKEVDAFVDTNAERLSNRVRNMQALVEKESIALKEAKSEAQRQINILATDIDLPAIEAKRAGAVERLKKARKSPAPNPETISQLQDQIKGLDVKIRNGRSMIPMEKAKSIYDSYIQAVKSNLEMLIQLFPERLRDIARLWYDGANLIAQDFSQKYHATLEQASGVLAVFSPQKDWFMNVSLAERMMRIWKEDQNTVWSQAMSDQYIRRAGEPQQKTKKGPDGAKIEVVDEDGNPVYQGGARPVIDEETGETTWENWDNEKAAGNLERARVFVAEVQGKRLRDLEPEDQARFIRMLSEVRDSSHYPKVTPHGEPGGLMTNEKGEELNIAWGGYNTIEKAIAIMSATRANEAEVISDALGDQHKVRSFYNNIVDPANESGHVTMDTHAVAALQWLPLSGASIEVSQNFGSAGVQNDSNAGLKGMYAANAKAYAEAARDFGLLPREVQSITWEAVRLLFPATWKSQAKNVAAVREVWDRYVRHELTIEAARAEIFQLATVSDAHPKGRDLAGAIADGSGVGDPAWATALGFGPSPSRAVSPADDAGILPSGGGADGRSGRPAAKSGRGDRGGNAPSVVRPDPARRDTRSVLSSGAKRRSFTSNLGDSLKASAEGLRPVPSSKSQVSSSGQPETLNLKPETDLRRFIDAATKGLSTAYAPLERVFMAAKSVNRNLTEREFGQMISAADAAGQVVLEPAESAAAVEKANVFGVRMASGVPAWGVALNPDVGTGRRGDGEKLGSAAKRSKSSLGLTDAISKIESLYTDPSDSDYWPDDVAERYHASPLAKAIDQGDFLAAWDAAPESAKDPAIAADLANLKAAYWAQAQYGDAYDSIWNAPLASVLTPAEIAQAKQSAEPQMEIAKLRNQKVAAITDEFDEATQEASDYNIEAADDWLTSDALEEAAKEPFIQEAKDRAKATIAEIEATGRWEWNSETDQFDDTGEDNTQVLYSAAKRSPVDAAAHAAATSPLNDLTPPTKAQQDEGNYKKGHPVIGGHAISIENPAGSKRRPEWPALKDHYGYFKGTNAKDGDHVDVFVKPGTPEDYAGPVHVVRQVKVENGKATKQFDEYKVMLGYPTAEEARAAYLRNYEPGWPGLERLTTHSAAEFARIKDQVFTVPADRVPGVRKTDQVLASGAKRAQTGGMADPDKAAQNAEPSPGGLSEAEFLTREWLPSGYLLQKGEWTMEYPGGILRGSYLSKQEAQQAIDQSGKPNIKAVFDPHVFRIQAPNGGEYSSNGAFSSEQNAKEVFLVANNLEEIKVWRAPDTTTKKFKQAFGNSKIVDAEGNPLLVKHGTRDFGFSKFKLRDELDGDYGVKLISFTASTRLAEHYARSGSVLDGNSTGVLHGKSPGIYEAYLKIERPLDLAKKLSDYSSDEVQAILKAGGISESKVSGDTLVGDVLRFEDGAHSMDMDAISRTFDGIIDKEHSDSFFVFSADQVILSSRPESSRAAGGTSPQGFTNLDPGARTGGFLNADILAEGAALIQQGFTTFATWSRAMLQRFGQGIKARLEDIWERVKPAAAEMLMNYMRRTGSLKEFFAGEQAIIPPFMRDSLDTAKAMAAAGKTSEEIRAVTGWFPGKYDGKMRWEIPDEAATPIKPSEESYGWGVFNSLKQENNVSLLLEEVIDHPALFEAYPKIRKQIVRLVDGMKGASFTPAADGWSSVITVGFDQKGMELGAANFSNLLHEVQHWIQEKEGTAKGSSSNGLMLYPQTRAALAKELEQVPDDAPSSMEQEIKLRVYRRTAGEIEARDIQARQSLTPEQRQATAPYSSENIAPEDAIVLMEQSGPQMSLPSPNETQSRFALRNASGIVATNMMVAPGPPLTSGLSRGVSAMASNSGAAQNAEPSPGGLSEAEVYGPLMHGSRTAGVKVFDPDFNREPPFHNGLKPWFFSETQGVAATYGPHVGEFYLAIKKPLELREIIDRDDEGEYHKEGFMLESEFLKLSNDEQELLNASKDDENVSSRELYKELQGKRLVASSYRDAFKRWSTDHDAIISYDTLDTLGSGGRDNIYIVFTSAAISTNPESSRAAGGTLASAAKRSPVGKVASAVFSQAPVAVASGLAKAGSAVVEKAGLQQVLAKLGSNNLDKFISNVVFGKVAKWAKVESGKQAVEVWLGQPGLLSRLAKGTLDQTVPLWNVPREWLAAYHESQRKAAWGREKAMDVIRALSHNAKVSDMAYPPEFVEDPAWRVKLFDAMEGKADLTTLPQPMQDLAARLRTLLRETGQELVRQGIMSLDTFEELSATGWMPRYTEEEAEAAGGSWLKAFKLGVKDLVAQRSTAWHIVDTTRKEKDGQYAIVSRDEAGKRNRWRFRNEQHRNAFYEDYIKGEAVKLLTAGGKEVTSLLAALDHDTTRAVRDEIKNLTREKIDRPAELSEHLRHVVRRAVELQRLRYKKEAPFEPDKLIKDPVYAIARYVMGATHNAATMELLKVTAKNAEWVSDGALAGFQQMPDNDRFGPLAGKYVRDEIATQVLDLVQVPGTILGAYDAILRTWKAGKLVLNPGSHIRDAVGNIVFGVLAGSNPFNPGNLPFYRDAIAALRDGGDTYAELIEMQVLGGDALTHEVKTALKGLLPDTQTLEGKPAGWIMRQIMGVGATARGAYEWAADVRQIPDNLYKTAAYLKYKAAGMSAGEAAAEVRKWFPYYDRLGTSGLIKQGSRFVMPFSSFFRESTRIMGRGAVERPLAMASILSFASGITALSLMMLGLGDEDEESVFRSMRGKLKLGLSGDAPVFAMLLPSRSGEGQLQQWDLSSVLPFADLLGTRVEMRQGEDEWTKFWRGLFTQSPILSTAWAWSTNTDAFSGRKIVQEDMGLLESSKERLREFGDTMLPPLTPWFGVHSNTLANAGRRMSNLETRNATQSYLRAIVGLDVRSADPNLRTETEFFRKEKNLPLANSGSLYDTPLKSRLGRQIKGELIQDAPDVEAVADALLRLEESGNPIKTRDDMEKLLKGLDPDRLIKEEYRRKLIQSFSPEAMRVWRTQQSEFNAAQRRLPSVMKAASPLVKARRARVAAP